MNFSKTDTQAVSKVLESGMNWAIGKEVEELESAVSKYVGAKYGITFCNGTAALHALMLAYNIKGEVIVPSFTFISTANCVLFVGATPVFAEIEEERYGLDPEDVERKITKNTEAIIAVHYGGMPCRIDELKAIAKKHHIILIEDACESLGASLKGKMVGSFGDCATFSFCQNKVVTSGEGGMVVTNDKKLADKLKLIRNHGKKGNDFVYLGYNFRMANILAALALSQFKRIEELIKKRVDNAKYIGDKLKWTVPSGVNFRNVFQLFTMRFCKDRDKKMKALEKAGISTKIYFEPIHLTNLYKSLGYGEGMLPVTEKISKEVLTLPMYPDLTRREMDTIATTIWRMIS